MGRPLRQLICRRRREGLWRLWHRRRAMAAAAVMFHGVHSAICSLLARDSLDHCPNALRNENNAWLQTERRASSIPEYLNLATRFEPCCPLESFPFSAAPQTVDRISTLCQWKTPQGHIPSITAATGHPTESCVVRAAGLVGSLARAFYSKSGTL